MSAGARRTPAGPVARCAARLRTDASPRGHDHFIDWRENQRWVGDTSELPAAKTGVVVFKDSAPTLSTIGQLCEIYGYRVTTAQLSPMRSAHVAVEQLVGPHTN